MDRLKRRMRDFVMIGNEEFYVESVYNEKGGKILPVRGYNISKFLPFYLKNQQGNDFYILKEYETSPDFIEFD